MGKGILHELKEPENIFLHFAKKTFSVFHRDAILPTLAEAYSIATSGRKGPVVVSIPFTFLEKEIQWPAIFPDRACQDHIVPDLGGLEEILEGKEKPLIIGGRSLMFEAARPIIESICRASSIPFLTTTSGKGIIREDRPYAFGNVMQPEVVRDMISSSDLVIAIGTRLRDADARRRGVHIKELVHIDIDDTWIGKNYPTRMAATGDLLPALEELRAALRGRRFRWDLTELGAAWQAEKKDLRRRAPGLPMIDLLRDVIPEEAIIVCDLNYPSYWAEYHLPIYHQQTFLMPRGISPIFYALPAAMGAKIGRPERPCIALCGDGGVLPTLGELATMAKYKIPVVVFLYNNGSFGILEELMKSNYATEGSMELTNPDFIKLARSFGLKAKRTATLEGLRKIFDRHITWDEPFLIEFRQPILPAPWRA